VSLYAGDSWKTTSKLTLNYGVRWNPTSRNGRRPSTTSIMIAFLKGVKSSVFVNAPAGLYYNGDPGFPEHGINPRWWQFAPRTGPCMGCYWERPHVDSSILLVRLYRASFRLP